MTFWILASLWAAAGMTVLWMCWCATDDDYDDATGPRDV